MERRTLARIFLGLALIGACTAGAVLAIRGRHPVSTPPASSSPSATLAAAQRSGKVVESIFDRKLGTGWEDWGYGRHEYKDGQPVKVSFTSYGAIIFHHAELPARFGGLAFRYKAPGFGHFLQVLLKSAAGAASLPAVDVTAEHTQVSADGWNEVWVPFLTLNPAGAAFDRVVIRARLPVGSEWVSLDRVGLTEGAAAGASGPRAVRKVRVAIDCKKPSHRISPLVYGVADSAVSLGSPAVRIGGNAMSRLNWDIGNVWNTGSDWFFQNVSAPKSLSDWLSDSVKDGLQVALVVPMVGWVAKDATSASFPSARFDPQRAHDPKRPEIGDGVRPDGKPITPGPPTLTSVPAPPELIGRWVAKLREDDRARGKRSVHMYILDNEPTLWHVTHRDVHPEPVGYDELLQRTIAYGTAIRKADPDAVIAGPAEWGWSGYFFSAKDLQDGRLLKVDRLSHGNVPLLPWYLQKLAAYEREKGVRILDVVDVHFYPQAQGVHSEQAGNADLADLRIRSTRAFWDATYRDESWVAEHVNLIPRLREWIASNYPGRGISIGEWSFGAENHISGALAIAELLGRFGQQGIRSAFYWRGPAAGTPASFAFRAFRNYDGKGAKFLDWSLSTKDAPGLSLFASRNEERNRITAVLLNLDANADAQIELDMAGCGALEGSRTFVYRAGPPQLGEVPGEPRKLGALKLDAHSFGVVEINVQAPPAAAPSAAAP